MALKDRRREVRLSAKDEDLLVEAAGVVGVSVTEFLLDRALSDAEQVVDEHRTIQLGETAYARFLEALDQPVPAPTELMEQAAKARPLKHVD
ncbi:MAG: type II toxin-antitoxin system TacA family antitoxin [Acidimicrobiales bacterium]